VADKITLAQHFVSIVTGLFFMVNSKNHAQNTPETQAGRGFSGIQKNLKNFQNMLDFISLS